MKSLLLLNVIALLSLGAAAQSAHDAPDRNTEIKDRFVGAWKLVSLEESSTDGQLHKADCAGMFVFTRDGRASVQVMYRNADTPVLMRRADTRLPTAATTSTTIRLSRFTSTAPSCER
jgi:Lipocalin-like domain